MKVVKFPKLPEKFDINNFITKLGFTVETRQRGGVGQPFFVKIKEDITEEDKLTIEAAYQLELNKLVWDDEPDFPIDKRADFGLPERIK